ncbi:hypothetical protein NA57DRAFT_56488 [Rhizodiscina lignyota]|uniref:Uncharacterized protein n=1 Tax=Rhizodiscina lignyota TaxID=1504668 RepID=A0A9P4IGH2_9PEZI|nr:hypothetical protein NA57DRAFT_56488 [Rhizodiscina lignyota]
MPIVEEMPEDPEPEPKPEPGQRCPQCIVPYLPEYLEEHMVFDTHFDYATAELETVRKLIDELPEDGRPSQSDVEWMLGDVLQYLRLQPKVTGEPEPMSDRQYDCKSVRNEENPVAKLEGTSISPSTRSEEPWATMSIRQHLCSPEHVKWATLNLDIQRIDRKKLLLYSSHVSDTGYTRKKLRTRSDLSR